MDPFTFFLVLGFLGAAVTGMAYLLHRRQSAAPAPRLPEQSKERHLYRITIPTFGQPELKRYDASQYEIPLVCSKCTNPIKDGESYYEIPIVNAEPGSVTGVHVTCERLMKIHD